MSRPPRSLAVAFWLYAGHLYTLFGIALSNVFAGLALLAAPWAWRAAPPAGKDSALDGPRHCLLTGLAVYVLTLAIAVAASPDPVHSARGFGELSTLVLLPLALLVVRGERRVRQVVDGVGFLGGVVALVGLAQFFGGFGEIDHRIRGPFSHWMTFSGYLLLCDLLLVAALLFGARRLARGADGWRLWWRFGWRAAALLAINAALLGSLTRSAWLGLAVALIFLVALRAPRWLAVLPVAAALLVIAAPTPLVGRALSTADPLDPSNYDRLCMVDAGLRMVADRPWTGIGPEMVEERYPIYRNPTAYRLWVPHLHDSFLQIAAERGLPAFAALLAMTVAPLVAAFRLYRREGRSRGPRADLLLGAVAAVVAFLVAGLFEYNWGDTEVQRLALFALALPFCLAGREPAGSLY